MYYMYKINFQYLDKNTNKCNEYDLYDCNYESNIVPSIGDCVVLHPVKKGLGSHFVVLSRHFFSSIMPDDEPKIFNHILCVVTNVDRSLPEMNFKE